MPLNQPPQAAPLLDDERTYRLEANGLQLGIREWGDPEAPPLVLLHGLRGYSATWRALARDLRDHVRLVAIDQRGRGASDWDPNRNYYTDAYLADLVTVVDALDLRRFMLLGHSMGGTVAYVYAATYPERLAGLIVEDIAPGSSIAGAGAERIRREMASLPDDFPDWAAARLYWRSKRAGLADAAIEERLAESLIEKAGRIAWRYDAAGIRETRLDLDPDRVVDLWPVVDRIRVPTLIVRGGASDFCPSDVVAQMEERNEAIAAVSVPGASHYVHDDAPDIYARHISDFLSPRLRPDGWKDVEATRQATRSQE